MLTFPIRSVETVRTTAAAACPAESTAEPA